VSTIFIDMTLRNAIRRILREATAPEGTGVMPAGGFAGTGVAPAAGGEATAPIAALQARARTPQALPTRLPPGPVEIYNKQVDRVAQKAAKALGMMELKYLAKSKRTYGAVAYKAISPNYMNVVIKIAPEHELQGYYKVDEIKQTMPEDVARHLPVIYKLTNMKKLGIEWTKENPNDQEQNLGIIVMEELDTLPYPIFDMIKSPPAADDFVLEVFLNDDILFGGFIEKYLISQQVSNVIEKFLNEAKPGYDLGDIEEVKTALRERLVLLRNFKYPRFEPSMFKRADLKKQKQRADILMPQIKRLIQQALARFSPGIELISDPVTELASEFSADLTGQARAIPLEPSQGGHFGIMSDAGILNDFKKSIKYMMNRGIFVSDLHANNLMIRPLTGEIVIADLGHFELEQNLPNAGSPI